MCAHCEKTICSFPCTRVTEFCAQASKMSRDTKTVKFQATCSFPERVTADYSCRALKTCVNSATCGLKQHLFSPTSQSETIQALNRCTRFRVGEVAGDRRGVVVSDRCGVVFSDIIVCGTRTVVHDTSPSNSVFYEKNVIF